MATMAAVATARAAAGAGGGSPSLDRSRTARSSRSDTLSDLGRLTEDAGDGREHSAGTATAMTGYPTELVHVPKKEPIEWVVGRYHELPRRVVVRSLEILDSRDSPDRPGMIRERTLREMVGAFDKVFANNRPDAKQRERDRKVDSVIHHLHRHTVRRRGAAVVQEGFIEWEQTSRVYELFSVNLNIFERIYLTVDVGESSSILSKICSFFLIGMIFLSIITWMISTLPSMQEVRSDCTEMEAGDCAPEPFFVFKVIEAISVCTFTLEYLIRFLTVHSVRFQLLDEFFLEAVLVGSREKRPAPGPPPEGTTLKRTQSSLRPPPDKLEGKCLRTLRKTTSPENLIDLMAILPFWFEVIQGGEEGGGGFLVVLRILRLTRVFRVFKLGKYNEVFTLFARVVEQSLPALLLMIFFIGLGCCLFGTLVWFAEQGTWYPKGHPRLVELGITERGAFLRHMGTKDDDDLQESPFYSICHSFWFVIVTITTVGYGDMFPTTPIGKIIGGLTILNGVIVLAMPIGVVGANFSSEYYKVLQEKKRRQRLKEQLDTLAAVEEYQDTLSSEENHGTSDDSPKNDNHMASELVRAHFARHQLLNDAEAMDHRWEKCLPPVLYQELTDQLRAVVSSLLSCDPATSTVPTPGAVMKPVISVTKLLDLDQLGTQVHAAIFSVTCIEQEALFGASEAVSALNLPQLSLPEALEQRQGWDTFVKDCWEYAIGMCRVEKRVEPAEYFQMKAFMARSAGVATPANPQDKRRTTNCCPRTDAEERTAPKEVSFAETDGSDVGLRPETSLPHRGDSEDCRNMHLTTTPPPSKSQEEQHRCSCIQEDPEVTRPEVKEVSEGTELPGMMTGSVDLN